MDAVEFSYQKDSLVLSIAPAGPEEHSIDLSFPGLVSVRCLDSV